MALSSPVLMPVAAIDGNGSHIPASVGEGEKRPRNRSTCLP